LDLLLDYYAKAGLLKPGAKPPIKPVLKIFAKQAGSTGNTIQVQFSGFNYSDPLHPTFDAQASETDIYPGLTPATIQTVLGSSPTNGQRPGLVFLPDPAPAEGALPKAGSYPPEGETAAKVDIPLNTGDGGVAFTLQAREDGQDGEITQVEIKDVDPTASTFTLVASWEKSAAKILVDALGGTFTYLIAVESTEAGGELKTPAPGTITLSGGSDATTAWQASAIVNG
jgi:hypothetical protein